jgi:hypothetical protein
MPLTEEFYGTNVDGTPNREYCSFCYKEGAFTGNETMDEMIDHCLKYLDEFNDGGGTKYTADEARTMMREFFPHLKRWQTN